MCTCRSFCRWLPVLFVVSLIAWCYVIFTLDVLQKEYLSLNPNDPPTEIGSHAQGVTYTVVFNTLFVLGMVSFVRAVFTDPGRIPDSWVYVDSVAQIPFKEAGTNVPPEALELTGERKQDGGFRICRKSKPNMYKPDRAHFCKMLSRCVLKMDHFCPWLNNCIGFFNHKYFYLFIFYMASLTVFMLVAMTPVFVRDVTSMQEADADFTHEFRVTLTYLVLCLLAIGLLGFWGFHTYLLLGNFTTIEFLEKRGCNPPPDHPPNRYDLGAYGNVCSVLGELPLVWLLPSRVTCEGDGLSFNLNPDYIPNALPNSFRKGV